MRSIILAGGFGTRLRPLTTTLPKPMVPMANRPMMEHIIGLLKRHKIKKMTSLLYFHPESIEGYFGDGGDFGVEMDYYTATVDLGTAGSVGAAMRERGGRKSDALVISGDVLTDINLKKAIAFHKKRGAIATIILTRVENPLPFGIVITDKDGKIDRFLEKPSWGEVFSDTINTGIYILDKKILNYIPEGEEFDFSNDLFPLLFESGEPLYGYTADGYWKDVGSLEEYRQANMDILSGKVEVDLPGTRSESGHLWSGEGSRIDFTTRIEGQAIVGKNCKIGPEARIINSVIGDNVTIEGGAKILNTVLWDDITIGEGARLHENIIGDVSEVGPGAYVGVGAILSDHCKVGRKSNVKDNVKIWPHKTVEDEATLSSSLIWGRKWGKNLFSTYGITGLANIELSPEFAAKVGAAYGASLPKGATVSTSRDAHKTSRMINRAVMTGLLSTGVNVDDYGVTPMPVVRYLARSGSEEIGGIHTRRSPYDHQILDMKFFGGSGRDLHPNTEKTIEKLFFKEDFKRVGMEDTGEMEFPIHGMEHYQTGFMKCIKSEAIKDAKFKVVLDYSYGSSSRIFPAILGSLNCEVIALNANLDGSKTTKTAEEFDKSLTQLSTIVKSLNADLGIVLDSGGEKIFLVDDHGEILDGDMALNLLTLLTLKCSKGNGSKGGIVGVPVTASAAIDVMAENYGATVVRTKTTPRGLMEAASSEGVLFVGETDGGFIFPGFQPCFDGMFAAVKILEMLALEGTKLHRLIREIPPSILCRDRVACPSEQKGMVMRRLAEGARGKKTLLIDGIRIASKNGWVVAYPSQDQPYFHLVSESGTEDGARKLISNYGEKIRGWQEKG